MPSPKRTARKKRATTSAARVIAGETVAAIATTENVSRRTVERDLRSPAAAGFIRSALQEHEGEVRELLALSLRVIRAGLEADHVDVIRSLDHDSGESEVVHVGRPDLPAHEIRLKASDRLYRLLQLGLEGEAAQGDGQFRVSWEEFERRVVAMRQTRRRLPPRGKS